MMAIFVRLLRLLSPETAHHWVVRFLKVFSFFQYRFLNASKPFPIAVHIRSSPTLKLRNRLGLAAGFDKNAEIFSAMRLLRFGFVEVGTVTPVAQSGNSGVRIFRKEPGVLVNRLGFNNCGLDVFRNNIARQKHLCPDFPILTNIGKNKATDASKAVEDYKKCFNGLKSVSDGFVVNVSSPNTPGLRDLQNISFLEEIAAIAPKGLPLFVKFSLDLANENLTELVTYVKGSSVFSGVVMGNTSQVLAQKLYGMKEGGLSGFPLFELSLEKVSIARDILKENKTIIGVGGVTNGLSAKRLVEAGADLIEIYTGFIYRGPGLVKEILNQLS